MTCLFFCSWLHNEAVLPCPWSCFPKAALCIFWAIIITPYHFSWHGFYLLGKLFESFPTLLSDPGREEGIDTSAGLITKTANWRHWLGAWMEWRFRILLQTLESSHFKNPFKKSSIETSNRLCGGVCSKVNTKLCWSKISYQETTKSGQEREPLHLYLPTGGWIKLPWWPFNSDLIVGLSQC